MRPSRHLTIALALSALLLLAVAGCGGGGGDTTIEETAPAEATAALTKAELISQGDDICAEVNSAVASVGSSAADTQSQVEQVSNLYGDMVSNLKNLGEPKEDAAEYRNVITAADELAAIEGEAKLAAEREDTEALGTAATKAAPALERFEAEAGAFGFQECSQGPGAPPVTSSGSEGETEEGEAGGIEPAPEEEIVPEEVAPEEVAPEEAGGGIEEVTPEEAAPEEGGGGSSGGVGPG